MIEAISSILIYNPHGYAYENGNGGVDFPITDSCERSAKVMGEDFVRLVFKLEHRVTFDAFSYIEYNGQTFFLREQYIPTPNGSIQDGSDVSSPYYSYDVKFVSVGNMLDKHVCYRHVKVNGDKPYEWYEPEIAINGTLETMYVIVMGAIKRIGDEYAANQMHYGTLLQSIAANGLNALGTAPNKDKVKITEGTKLLTFNFSGDNIANVCTTIANNYTNDDNKDTEWYITEDESGLTLHFAKYVSDAGEQVVSDYIKEDVGNYHYAHPYVTGGLKKVEYAQAWSGITQKIVPYGSDRNMSGQAVKGIDEITQLQSTFGKRLRLDPNTSYNVKDKDGNVVVITTDHNGAVENNYVNTGIEQVKFYDDIYPQGHFKITSVTIKNKRQEGETIPEYTIEASPIDSNGNDISKESVPDGFYPIKIEEGTTLSVRFEKGMLNGREFEIANKTRKDEGATTYSLKFTIVADGSIEDGTLIPSGNFRPYEGDQFALFNMKMPEVYVEQAKNELAQKVYDELVELQTTRPEVKCTTDPVNFTGEMALGNVYRVSSELFNSEHTFVSRVISYSYKLTKTNDIQFSLASAIMQGTLSSMNDLISDVTHATGGLEQRAINLSRRAWRDASEVAEMIDSITTEMMLVGSEKNQFAFTMGIDCVDADNKFSYLEVGYGSIQHTQEPYIDYANQGFWEVGTIRLSKDEVGQDLNPDLAYYLYAKVDETTSAQMVLSTEDNSSNEAYLLLGILSSEFEGKRVFSRTNGFTAIEGGTITTEQIQDAGRNLIIDFQSKTPRIIARNGAEIIGNIKFKASDEMTAEEQLAALGIGVSQAQSTANAAIQAADTAQAEAARALGSISNLQEQIDGEVTSWFLEGEPWDNYRPADQWTDQTLKDRHLGDTYTNILPIEADLSKLDANGNPMWFEQGSLRNGSGTLTFGKMRKADATFIRTKTLLELKPSGVVITFPTAMTGRVWYFKSDKTTASLYYNTFTNATSITLRVKGSSTYTYYFAIDIQTSSVQDVIGISCDETFTNPEAGKSWRWCNNDDTDASTYHWHLIADSDATKALAEAAKASAAADGKSKTFVIEPTNYAVGDLWILQSDTDHPDGKKGDMLTANAASDTYNEAHWSKEVKYTDDTAVDNLEVGGRNLLRYTDQSAYFNKFTAWHSSLSLVDGWIKVTQNSGDSTSGVITDKTSDISLLEKGKSYILSFDAYLDGSASVDTLNLSYHYVMSDGGNFALQKSVLISKTKARYNVAFTYNGTTIQSFGAMVGATTTNCPIFYVKNIKLEKGNKATDWTCAPEDTDDAIDKVSSVAVYSGNISEKYYEADLAHSCWLCSVGAYPCETSATENNGYTNAADPYNASCIVVTRAGEKNVYIDTLDYIDILGVYSWGETIDVGVAAELSIIFAEKHYVQYVINNGFDGSDMPSGGSGTWTISNISIKTSNADVAKAAMLKAEATEYLKDALTDGSTEIAGGLVMTNVLMLKNLNKQVTAGMSGMTTYKSKEDKVLMWGGGTYEEAYAAANSENYYKSGTTPITTLLKKDGTGKIGIFKISDTQAIVDVPNQGKVIIDASTTNGGIRILNSEGRINAALLPTSISSFKPLTDNSVTGSERSVYFSMSTQSVTSTSKTITLSRTGSFTTSGTTTETLEQYTKNTIVTTNATRVSGNTAIINGTVTTNGYDMFVTVKLELLYNGSVISSIQHSEEAQEGQRTVEFSNISRSFSSNITSTVSVSNSNNLQLRVTVSKTNASSSSASINAVSLNVSMGSTYMYYKATTKTSYTYPPQTIIGSDGLISLVSNSMYFMVDNTGSTQKIYVKGLSTTKGSTAGSGELYISNYSNEGLVKTLYDGFAAISEVLEKCKYEGSNAKAQENAKNACTDIRTALSQISIIANT